MLKERRNIFCFQQFHSILNDDGLKYICVIDQACSVKMAGCLFMEQDGVEVQYPAILTEPAWSIKDLLYGIRAPLLAGHSGNPGQMR